MKVPDVSVRREQREQILLPSTLRDLRGIEKKSIISEADQGCRFLWAPLGYPPHQLGLRMLPQAEPAAAALTRSIPGSVSSRSITAPRD